MGAGTTNGQPNQQPQPTEQQPAQQPTRQRRVTFDEASLQQQHHQRQPLPVSGRRGAGRGRPVPDHVANPHKYTVYVLDEPIMVGQGGGDVASQAAADSWAEQRQQLLAAGSSSGGGGGSGSSTRDARRQAVLARAAAEAAAGAANGGGGGGGECDAAMDVEEAGGDGQAGSDSTQVLPGAGAIKFQPTRKFGLYGGSVSVCLHVCVSPCGSCLRYIQCQLPHPQSAGSITKRTCVDSERH